MRGHQMRVAGSVIERRNHRYTAVTPPLHDGGHGKVRRSLGTFDTSEQALEVLRKANLAGFRTVASIPPSELAEVPLADYLDGWLLDLADEERTGRISRRTRTDYEQVVKIHIVPPLGRVRLGDLTTDRVTGWLGEVASGRTSVRPGRRPSERTVQKVHRVLHLALGDAGLPTNPARLARRDRPRVHTTKTIVRPTVEEVCQFLTHVAACDRHGAAPLLPLWRLMATTGMRRSEALGLGWDQVRLDGDPATVSVVRGLHYDGGFYIGRPKSRESKRSVGLDPHTAALLADLRERSRGLRPVLVGSGERRVELDLVFRSERGHSPLSPDLVTRVFVQEWGHAGGRPGVTLHGLRHGLGSALLAEGRPVTEVAALLGHSPAVLLQVYGRDLDASKRHAAVAEVTARLYG